MERPRVEGSARMIRGRRRHHPTIVSPWVTLDFRFGRTSAPETGSNIAPRISGPTSTRQSRRIRSRTHRATAARQLVRKSTSVRRPGLPPTVIGRCDCFLMMGAIPWPSRRGPWARTVQATGAVVAAISAGTAAATAASASSDTSWTSTHAPELSELAADRVGLGGRRPGRRRPPCRRRARRRCASGPPRVSPRPL